MAENTWRRASETKRRVDQGGRLRRGRSVQLGFRDCCDHAQGFADQFIAKTPGSEWMFIVYSVGLLANFNSGDLHWHIADHRQSQDCVV